MATLNDIRDAGYTIALAWAGWDDVTGTYPDVHLVTHPATGGEDPAAPDLGLLTYVSDTPDAIEQFLAGLPHGAESG